MNYVPTISLIDYQNGRLVFQTLNAIKEMVKSDFFHELGFQSLEVLDPELLEPQNQAIFYYVKSRYFFYSYRRHVRFTDLEKADNYLDMMIRSAGGGKALLKPKHFFARAHVKYLMYLASTRSSSKKYYFEKVKHLVESAKRYYPNESSFAWLERKINEN